jgi:hypothetical protein
MQKFLDALVAKLPARVRPYAKGLIPITLAVVVVLQDLVVSVEEVAELKVLAAGAVASLITIYIRNDL